MGRRLFTSITLIFFLSCNNDITQTSEENPLLGKWTETFSWTNIFDCGSFVWDSECPEVSETSTIEFTENTFEVTILPPSWTYVVENDTIYIGLASDTLFTGSYEISNDTIIFSRDDSFDPTNVEYWFENDSLHLSAIAEFNLIVFDGDTSYLAPLAVNSIVWGNAWLKTGGIFGRIE
ncbi:MAG: hypothetical protein HQ510_09720 [Candidatus Marinimicrobia bacterium]|nr:hypothetical protein [Candidatus Neomarinimicrobiota bacterium]